MRAAGSIRRPRGRVPRLRFYLSKRAPDLQEILTGLVNFLLASSVKKR